MPYTTEQFVRRAGGELLSPRSRPPLRKKKIQRLPSWDIDQRSASPGSAFKV
jgi:hypothetical protein